LLNDHLRVLYDDPIHQHNGKYDTVKLLTTIGDDS
jgi:hypothetical protein